MYSGSAGIFNASSAPTLFGQHNSSSTVPAFGGASSSAPSLSEQHNSSPTGTTFGATSSPLLFGQQSSSFSSFGGVPSTSSVSGLQSSSFPPFGVGVVPSTSSVSGLQSSSFPPFGVGVAPSTSLAFASTAHSHGVHSKLSSFGHLGFGVGSVGASSTPSMYGSSLTTFQGASTTPPFAQQNSTCTFHSTGSSTAPLFAQPNSTCSRSSGLGGRTRLAPHRPTFEAEELRGGALISISAMNAYCDKSHEELRAEDYKQERIEGPNPHTDSLGVSKHSPHPFQSSSSSFVFPGPALSPNWSSEHVNKSTSPFHNSSFFLSCPPVPSNFAPIHPSDNVLKSCVNKSTSPFQTSGSNFQSQTCATSNFAPIHSSENVPKSSGWCPPQAFTTQTNAAPSSTAPQTSDANKTSNVNVNPAAPQTGSANETSNINLNPATPQTSVPNEITNVNANGQTSSTEELVGASFIPAFVNCVIPAFGALGLNGGNSGAQPLNPELGTTIFVPTAVALIPQHPRVSAPAAALPMPASDIQSIPRMIPVTGWPFTGVLGGQSSNSSTFYPTPPTSVFPSASTFPSTTSSGSWSTANVPKCSPEDSRVGGIDPSLGSPNSIPKGLELIVQTLGANPWADKDHLDNVQAGKILPCDDASYDADIVSLAEFAVEQHNAMDKDNKVKLLKVNAACLEAVDGGRYHLVLETSKGPSLATRVYAAVLRKKTDRPTHLIVLERWLPGLVFGVL